jgi:hypothetical protein
MGCQSTNPPDLPNQSTAPISETMPSTWDRYQDRSLEEQISLTGFSSQPEATMYFDFDTFPSRVRVIYTGESRPISPQKQELLSLYIEMRGDDPSIVDFFQTEYRFLEGSSEYWLPIQHPLIPYLEDELEVGDTATLFVILIGANAENGALDHVILINEFIK